MDAIKRRRYSEDRKPGRPKKDGSRTIPFMSYFTEAEAAAIRKLASALGVSVSQLMHHGTVDVVVRAQAALKKTAANSSRAS